MRRNGNKEMSFVLVAVTGASCIEKKDSDKVTILSKFNHFNTIMNLIFSVISNLNTFYE